MKGTTRFAVLASLVVGVACAGSGGPDASTAGAGPMADGCGPVDATLEAGSTMAGMAGRYRLTMVRSATRDPRGAQDTASAAAGPPAAVQGELTLTPRPAGPALRSDYATPLQGVAEIELEAVGAQRVGSLDSDDPNAPGVLVLERDDAEPEILLRFGSSANRTDPVAFDEAFTVLDVRRIARGGFAGSWRSGLRQRVVSGHFCAEPAG